MLCVESPFFRIQQQSFIRTILVNLANFFLGKFKIVCVAHQNKFFGNFVKFLL